MFDSLRLRYATCYVYTNITGTDGEHKDSELQMSSDEEKLNCFTTKIFAVLGIILVIVVYGLTISISKAQLDRDPQISFLPQIDSTTLVIFEPNYIWHNMSDPRSNQAWNSLGDATTFIVIDDPSRFGLPPGIERPDGNEGYAVSVYHQLHCLKILRAQYSALMNGESRPSTQHADHCFDYLRQAIQCYADITLEKARISPDGGRRETDGWGTTHQCRDWSKVNEMIGNYHEKFAKIGVQHG